MKKTTRVNHPPPVELPAGNRALVAPIYQSVKFEFETIEATEAYITRAPRTRRPASSSNCWPNCRGGRIAS
jgi:hypothetical protein